MTTSPAVLAEDLRATRGGREVLSGLSFSVPAGSVTGLLGPSGGGKSTLLRAVVGEVPLARLWHAVPSFPTVSEVWLRLLEGLRD